MEKSSLKQTWQTSKRVCNWQFLHSAKVVTSKIHICSLVIGSVQKFQDARKLKKFEQTSNQTRYACGSSGKHLSCHTWLASYTLMNTFSSRERFVFRCLRAFLVKMDLLHSATGRLNCKSPLHCSELSDNDLFKALKFVKIVNFLL